MRRVWLAQCLCGPNRHAIIGGVLECEESEIQTLAELLSETVSRFVDGNIINRWCGICASDRPHWYVEVIPTAYRNLAEAGPAIAEVEALNLAASAMMGTHGPDKPTRH